MFHAIHNIEYFDAVNALFAVGLAVAQMDAIRKVYLKGEDLRELPSPALWLFISAWGLFSLQMYIHLNYWLSFVANLACVGGNAGLIVLAIKRYTERVDAETDS